MYYLLLRGNCLSDQGIQRILGRFRGEKNLKSIVYERNEAGLQFVGELRELVSFSPGL